MFLEEKEPLERRRRWKVFEYRFMLRFNRNVQFGCRIMGIKSHLFRDVLNQKNGITEEGMILKKRHFGRDNINRRVEINNVSSFAMCLRFEGMSGGFRMEN